MGACNIEFKMDGSVSFFFVEKQFKARSDKKEFSNYNDANDYCLNNARKGKTVIAVKYKNTKGKLIWLIAGWGAC